MPSPGSSSPASPDRPARSRRLPEPVRRGWPSLLLLPALVAILGAATLTPLIALFLGESFGLSGGREAPWPGALALIGLVAYWTGRLIAGRPTATGPAAAVVLGAGLLTILLWWGLEPAYDLGPVLRHPVSLVRDNAYLIPSLLLGSLVWWQGLRYAYDGGLFAAEEIRGRVQRSWLVLIGSIILAAAVGGEAGDAAVASTRIAVPVAMIASVAAVAAAEIESTRRIALRRGSAAPGWDKWARLVSGLTAGVLLLTIVGTVLFGPGVLAALVDLLVGMLRLLGYALAYLLFAIIYAIFTIGRVITSLLTYLFGDIFGEVMVPEPPEFLPAEQEPFRLEQTEPGETPYATLLRWILLGIALLVIAVIIYRMTRTRDASPDEGTVDEERESIFSADLARQQLRQLFRRRPRPPRPPRLDLDRPPASTREAMLYLQVLARRQQTPRRPEETPADFAIRLANAWPGVGAALRTLQDRYERVRYGDQDDDPALAAQVWATIWERRRHVEVGPERH